MESNLNSWQCNQGRWTCRIAGLAVIPAKAVTLAVVPAKAGTQWFADHPLDPGFRRDVTPG